MQQGTPISGTATSKASTPTTTAPPIGTKAFDKPALGLYAASDGKLRKIANGQFRWAQWLPDDVALPETTTDATTTTTTSPPGSVVLPVTQCPTGYSFTPPSTPPVVPPTVRVSIGSADAKALSAYSDGINATVLAPKGWQCSGWVSVNGSFWAAPTVANDRMVESGPRVTVATDLLSRATTTDLITFELPSADRQLCSTIVDTYLAIAQPSVG